MDKTRSLAHAEIAMWSLIGVSVLVAAVDRHVGAFTPDEFLATLVLTCCYAVLPHKIGQGRDWARFAYAASVAFNAAVLVSGDAAKVPRLDFVVGALTYPVELWVVWTLFRKENGPWFTAPGDR